jgi:hypothetical protein
VVATLARSLAGPSRPLGSPEIPQFHAPTSLESGVYTPWLYGAAQVHFAERKRRLDERKRVAFRVQLEPDTRTVDWEQAQPMELLPEQLLTTAPVTAGYLPLPSGAMDTKVFTRWAKKLDRWLARTQRLNVTASDGEPTTIGPKRGGVSVDLVAILWELR